MMYQPVLPRLTSTVLILLSLSFHAGSAMAATRFWTGAGGDNLWANTNNWNPAIVPGLTDKAEFNASSGGGPLIDLGGNIALGQINYQNGTPLAFTIGTNSDQVITVGNGPDIVIQNGSPDLTIAASLKLTSDNYDLNNNNPAGTSLLHIRGNITKTNTTSKWFVEARGSGDSLYSGVISDGGTNGSALGINKASGTGTLTISNALNSFTRGLNVSQGTLEIAAQGSLGGGWLAIGNATANTRFDHTLNVGVNAPQGKAFFWGATGVGVTQDLNTSPGTLTLNGGIGGDNNSRGTKIISGKLNLASASEDFSGNGVPTTILAPIMGLSAGGQGITFSSGRWILAGTNTYDGDSTIVGGLVHIGIDPVGTPGAITSSAIGTSNLVFNGTTAGGVSSDNGTPRLIINPVIFATGGKDGRLGDTTLNGKLTLANTVTMVGGGHDLAVHSDVDIDGVISGGAWSKSADGTLTLNNTNNNYTGNSGVTAGILRSGASHVVPDATSISIGGTGTFDLNGFNDIVNGDGVRAIFLAVNAQPQVASITTGAGTLTIGDDITSDSNAYGNHAISGNLNLGSATRIFSIGVGSNNRKVLSISANISGDPGVGIIYTGVNTKLILSGTNTYDGGASVASLATMTYLNTAAKPATGTVTVATGATLGLGVGAAPARFTSADVDALFTNGLALVDMHVNANVGIDTSAGDFEHSGNITSSNGLTKLGPNTLTLSGTNLITGPIFVDEGKLILSGDMSGSSADLTTFAGTELEITSPSAFPTGSLILAGPLTYSGPSTTLTEIGLTGSTVIDVSNSGSTVFLPGATGPAGGGSLTKEGPGALSVGGPSLYTGATIVNGGTIIFTEPQTYTGATTINSNGTIILRGGDHTLVVNRDMFINGGTLDIEGNDQYVRSVSGTGAGVVTATGGTLTINQPNVAYTFDGTFAGSLNIVKAGLQTLTLTGDHTTTGAFGVIGNSVTIKDDGAFSSVASVNVNGSTLNIDNTGTTELNDRLNDSAGLALNSGSLIYKGRASTNSTETLGTVMVNTGMGSLTATAGGTGSAELTLTSLVRSTGATLKLDGSNLGTAGNSGRIFVSGGIASLSGSLTPINGIIPGVFRKPIGGLVSQVGYVDALGFGSVGQAGGFPATFNGALDAAAATDNVAGASAWVVKSGGQTINSMTPGNLTFLDDADTLIIGSGMITYGGESPGKLGVAGGIRGKITSGTNELFWVKQNGGSGGGASANINSVITDNGASPVKFVIASYERDDLQNQRPFLSAHNTYSGGTVMSGGNTLLLGASSNGWMTIPAAADPAMGLVIENSQVQMQSFAQQIDPANIVTLNGGSRLTLFGANNTLAGLVFNNNGGTTQPTVTGGIKLTLTGNIASTPSNLHVTPLISVALDLGDSDAHAISVAALPEGNRPNNGVDWAPLNGLQISSVIQNGGFTKKGDGVLYLTGNNTFTGQLTVAEGVLNVNALNNINSDGRLGNSALPVVLGGSGTTGTLEYSSNNNPNSNKPFTLASGGTGAFQIDWTIRTTTLSGDINGDGDFRKTGPGTLSLTGAKTYTGDTHVDAGTLQINNAYLDAGADVYLTSGAVFQLDYSGSNDVSALYLDGLPQPVGTYGRVDSGADFESAFFAGNGTLNVIGFTPLSPTAFFSATPTNGVAPLAVTFTDTSTGTITNRFWDFGDGITTNTTATSVFHTYTSVGTYRVELIVSGPLGSSTNTQADLVVVTTGAPPTPSFDGSVFTLALGTSSIQFDTVPGVQYGVDYKDVLTNAVWLPLIYEPDYPLPEGWSSTSTGGVLIVVDTNAVDEVQRFYRLKAMYPAP